MDIAIVLYDRFTALDAIGPYEVLSRLPGARVTFVAAEPGPVKTDNGMLAVRPSARSASCRARRSCSCPAARARLPLAPAGRCSSGSRAAHETSEWTTSVCTGSLILAAAGLLDGRPATGHWLAMDALGALGAQPVAERVVFDGRIVTAAGVSAGIDMALALAARVAGEQLAQAIQLGIEYDPQPPFSAGSPATAPAEIVAMLRGASRFEASGAAAAQSA